MTNSELAVFADQVQKRNIEGFFAEDSTRSLRAQYAILRVLCEIAMRLPAPESHRESNDE